jgi:ribosomal protein S18 acetylase RimI-like enzyme
MIRKNLEQIPEFELPDGFSLRQYRPGDEENWLRIHLVADRLQPITPELYVREFGSDRARLSERQYFLLAPNGQAIGTATAWFKDNFEGRRFGRVHWVAIVPEYQGRGLAKPLMSTICRRLQELGHDCAYLTTSTARLPAINLYRRFGFEPLIRTPEEADIWKRLDLVS